MVIMEYTDEDYEKMSQEQINSYMLIYTFQLMRFLNIEISTEDVYTEVHGIGSQLIAMQQGLV